MEGSKLRPLQFRIIVFKGMVLDREILHGNSEISNGLTTGKYHFLEIIEPNSNIGKIAKVKLEKLNHDKK